MTEQELDEAIETRLREIFPKGIYYPDLMEEHVLKTLISIEMEIVSIRSDLGKLIDLNGF